MTMPLRALILLPFPFQLTGVVGKVTVMLTGFSHDYPNDVSVLLVGPAGQAVELMAAAGYNIPVSDVDLTFDDTA